MTMHFSFDLKVTPAERDWFLAHVPPHGCMLSETIRGRHDAWMGCALVRANFFMNVMSNPKDPQDLVINFSSGSDDKLAREPGAVALVLRLFLHDHRPAESLEFKAESVSLTKAYRCHAHNEIYTISAGVVHRNVHEIDTFSFPNPEEDLTL